MSLTAFVDESIQMKAGGVYLLGAVIVESDQAAGRQAVRDAVPRRRRRWHWHSEDTADRLAMVAHLATTDLGYLVVWAALDDPRRQERARAVALRRLAWELGSRQVTEIVFEFRQPALNRRDQKTIDFAKRSGHAREVLDCHFVKGAHEPLLWAADALAGAAFAAVAGDDPRFLDLLGARRVELVRADP